MPWMFSSGAWLSAGRKCCKRPFSRLRLNSPQFSLLPLAEAESSSAPQGADSKQGAEQDDGVEAGASLAGEINVFQVQPQGEIYRGSTRHPVEQRHQSCRNLFRLSSNPGPHGLRLNSAIGGFHIMVRLAVDPQGSLARQ